MIQHKKIISPIFIFLIGYFIKLLLNVVIARWSGASQYGIFAVDYRLISLIAVVLLFGTAESITKFLPERFSKGRWDAIKLLLYQHARIILIISMVFIALMLLLLILFQCYSEESHALFHYGKITILIASPFFAFNLFFSRLLGGLKHPAWSGFTSKVLFYLILLVSLALLEYKTGHLDLAMIFTTLAIAIVTVVLIQIYALYFYLPKPFFTLKLPKKAEWPKVSLVTFFLSTVIFILSNQVNLYMVQLLHHDGRAAGYFAAILTIAISAWLPRNAAKLVYRPVISLLISTKDWNGLRIQAKKSARWMSLITGFILLGILVFSHEILSLFGNDFSTLTLPLFLVALGFSIKSLFSTAESILKYSGHANKNLLLQLAAMLINIFLCFILIPSDGLIGAAISLLVSRGLLALSQYMLVMNIFNINTFLV